ncbi:hypothetical protein CTI12_AA344090 [Artemisia annua]|uniref:Uncharacterized protein n=1 Tax=Artemisia annua TaxID=35608 RepID=A0A2U1MT40_ARTAN|nr:hypothetical protein CTI12_AA344090 [Artemisia annua]
MSIAKLILRQIQQGPYPLYEDLGDCTYRCRYCGAAFWYGERVKRASTATRTEYHLCCGDGKIIMQQQPDPPQYFQDLFGASPPRY